MTTSKITAEQFKEMYIDEDNEVDLPGTDCVEVDEDVEGKYVTYSNVYKVGDQFFNVYTVRANTGYWGDSDICDSGVEEVFAKTITKVIYATK